MFDGRRLFVPALLLALLSVSLPDATAQTGNGEMEYAYTLP